MCHIHIKMTWEKLTVLYCVLPRYTFETEIASKADRVAKWQRLSALSDSVDTVDIGYMVIVYIYGQIGYIPWSIFVTFLVPFVNLLKKIIGFMVLLLIWSIFFVIPPRTIRYLHVMYHRMLWSHSKWQSC